MKKRDIVKVCFAAIVGFVSIANIFYLMSHIDGKEAQAFVNAMINENSILCERKDRQ